MEMIPPYRWGANNQVEKTVMTRMIIVKKIVKMRRRRRRFWWDKGKTKRREKWRGEAGCTKRQREWREAPGGYKFGVNRKRKCYKPEKS